MWRHQTLWVPVLNDQPACEHLEKTQRSKDEVKKLSMAFPDPHIKYHWTFTAHCAAQAGGADFQALHLSKNWKWFPLKRWASRPVLTAQEDQTCSYSHFSSYQVMCYIFYRFLLIIGPRVLHFESQYTISRKHYKKILIQQLHQLRNMSIVP